MYGPLHILQIPAVLHYMGIMPKERKEIPDGGGGKGRFGVDVAFLFGLDRMGLYPVFVFLHKAFLRGKTL